MPSDYEPEVRCLYEQYKLQWMLYHGIGLADLIDCMEIMIHEDLADGGTRKRLQDLFEAWEFGVGFSDGLIWPCFEEYRDCEYDSDPGRAYMLISVSLNPKNGGKRIWIFPVLAMTAQSF